MTPVRLAPTALRSRVKHSTTEPLRSLLHIMKFAHMQLRESVYCCLNQSQQERKLIQISGEMYNPNSNLTPMMLAIFLSLCAVRAVQIYFNFKNIVSKIQITTDCANYGLLILPLKYILCSSGLQINAKMPTPNDALQEYERHFSGIWEHFLECRIFRHKSTKCMHTSFL